MKSPKVVFGILFIILGAVMTYYFYADDNYLETFGGLFFGVGVGLLIWFWMEKKNLIYKYPIDNLKDSTPEDVEE